MSPQTYVTRTQQAMAVFYGFLLAVSLVVLLYVPIPNENNTSIGLVIGAIIAASAQTQNWLFGSTKDSKEKDLTISRMADGMANGAEQSNAAAKAEAARNEQVA